MRVPWLPLAIAGAGLVALGGVNVLAANAAATDPPGRLAPVDPFAVSADGAPQVDGSGAAAWHAAAPPSAPQVLAETAASGQIAVPATNGSDATAGAHDEATPLSHEVVAPARQLTRTLDEWVSSVSSATGIPRAAVRAYGDATLTMADEDPACRLGWPTIAGIGWIESGHGTHGHAVLGDDGVPSIPIVGPALDGSPGRAAIHSTPQSVQWHGDPVWDHAVGPMQFIPSTWARWAADGDGDGVANPQDIDDAALATARYLCAGSRDLSTWDGWHAAVLSYNHAESYVQSVYARANAYATTVGG